MRNISLAILMLLGSIVYAQIIPPAPADKAVVYFVRISDYGMFINFTYFDSTKLIGKYNDKGYFRYECDPGFHIFWARSENKDFVEAELDPGKIYFIEAAPGMGVIKTTVDLHPVDPTNKKKMEKIKKLLNKFEPYYLTPKQLLEESAKSEDIVAAGMKKYHDTKKVGIVIARLEKTMYYKNE